jgi:hypothetical protein
LIEESREMNTTYRSVWNEALGTWVAVSEATRARGKRAGGKVVAALVLAVSMAGITAHAGNQAMGAGAVASGLNDSACGNGNVAVGNGNAANYDSNGGTGTGTVPCTTAGPVGTVAIGNLNTALGQGAIAVGNQSKALVAGAMALGDQANASAGNAIALGNTANASGTDAVAIGTGAVSSGANGSRFRQDGRRRRGGECERLLVRGHRRQCGGGQFRRRGAGQECRLRERHRAIQHGRGGWRGPERLRRSRHGGGQWRTVEFERCLQYRAGRWRRKCVEG